MKKLIVVLLLLVPVSVWGGEPKRIWHNGECYEKIEIRENSIQLKPCFPKEPKCHWEIKRILATSGTTIPLGWEPFGVTTKYDFFNLANGIPLMIPQIDYCHLWLRRKVCEGEK